MVSRFVLALTLVLVAIAPRFAPVHAAAAGINHIYTIMEENTDYNDIVGNVTDAPYLNSLIDTYGFAANYYGVTHPSLPNYVAATAGDFFGLHSDSPSQTFAQTNIVDQLESHGKTWAAYMQAMPSAGYTGQVYPLTGSLYVNKHNPFVLYKDILDNPTRLQHIKPVDQLASDLASGTAPNYVWISPDVCHDMHGMGSSGASANGFPWCAYPPNNTVAHALIQHGDQYAQQLVSTIMSSPSWTADSAIVITWDENDYAGTDTNVGYGSTAGCCASPVGYGGGRVPAIVIIGGSKVRTVSLQPYNHYSLMRTIEDAFGLGCLNHTCDAAVQPMSDLFQPTGSSVAIPQTQGFAVTFSSAAAGQGYVYFGPNCQSLVMVATHDLGAGTTTHTVIVSGNDMPGTIGDVGLTPGQSYAYEVLTVSPSGTQTDNNSGACYSFTVESQ